MAVLNASVSGHGASPSDLPAVLLAEPDAHLRDALQRLLQDEGMKVHTVACDQSDLFDAAHRLHPDVLVLSARLPGSSGIRVASRLHSELPRLPLILYSGTVGPFVEEYARQAGACAVVRKGADPDQLVQAVIAAYRQFCGSPTAETSLPASPSSGEGPA